MTGQYSVVIEVKAVKQIKKLDRPQRALLINWIAENLEGCENPYVVSGAKKLEGIDNGVRYRVGNYRILATVHKDLVQIKVFTVGHRSQVYRNLK
ncbi:MAG: type II toxin-antitoxin system RelE/ParE family toxin [Coriobacteriia bacterium]|nr:type II toxin-antitoxin system RelE/ParE family toxin [Coriobacteriia bacterium]